MLYNTMHALFFRKRKADFTTIMLFAFVVLFPVFMHGQNQKNLGGQEKTINTITTAVPFLMIAPDSRAGGMGDAGVASSPDANSIHWNPSKLAFTDKKFGLGISYTPWLRALVPDINLAYLSGYYKVKKDQTLGMSLLYFSLGDITFTDIAGYTIGQYRPNEFAIDVAYSRKLADNWSGGMAIRYIHSNLTGELYVNGSATHPGNSVAADISAFYTNSKIKVADKKSTINAGLNFSNIGSKISYTDRSGPENRDFIPINMRLGSALNMKLDEANTFGFMLDFNKLLVPTPPRYELDPVTKSPKKDLDGKYIIEKGQDPDRGIASGIFGSFNDAPDGMKEELRELTYSAGLEWWYDNQFAIRGGFFYEHATKGNRKFFTLGAGLKYNVFGLDFAYLIPTEQKHPLENTLRFTLLFNFEKSKKEGEGGDSGGTTTN